METPTTTGLTRRPGLPSVAVLLAAGRGTRLRDSTGDPTPKCVQTVGGRPFISYALEHLAAAGVVRVLMNVHYGAEVVRATLGDGSAWGVHIDYLYEPELLGTAGTVRAATAIADPPFLVWYGDNFSFIRLDAFADVHARVGSEATVAVFPRDDVRHSGVVELAPDGLLRSFVEKPPSGGPGLVNAGIYLLNSSVIASIPTDRPSDFGRDVLPQALRSGVRMAAYRLSDREGLLWIDTASDLAYARAALSTGARRA